MRFQSDERGYLRVQRRGGGGGGLIAPILVALGLVGLVVWFGGGEGGTLGTGAREAVLVQRYEAVLADRGLTPGAHHVHTDVQCTRFFTGELRTLMANTPCRSIRRAVFAATDAHGNRVVMSIAWVGMPDQQSASAVAEVFGSRRGGVGVLPAPHVPAVSAPGASRSTNVVGSTAVLIAANTSSHGSPARLLGTATNEVAGLPPL
jgi:hypothetical protein